MNDAKLGVNNRFIEGECLSCAIAPVKCCDFSPFVANFRWASILSSRQKPKSSRILSHQSSNQKKDLLPIGVCPREEFSESMSRQDGLSCQFYLKKEGLCSIWENRPTECRKYLCPSLRKKFDLEPEKTGHRPTPDQDQEYELAALVLLQAGYDWVEVQEQLEYAQGLKFLKEADQARLWAHWQGRRAEFYAQVPHWAEISLRS